MSRKGCDNPTPQMLYWRERRAKLTRYIQSGRHDVPIYKLAWPAPSVQ